MYRAGAGYEGLSLWMEKGSRGASVKGAGDLGDDRSALGREGGLGGGAEIGLRVREKGGRRGGHQEKATDGWTMQNLRDSTAY